MFKSFLLIGIRNLLKQKGYSFIKIAGLAFGLATSMIIYLYVYEDVSYDKIHQNYDRIARLLTIDNAEGVSSKVVAVVPPPLGPAAEAELPEVLKSARLQGGSRQDLTYEDKTLKCDAYFRTESSFFEIFDFEIVEGKKEGVLDEPNTIAVTETLAKRIFGDETAIGKTIRLNQNQELSVVAVVKDPPKNSHIQFDLLRSLTPSQGDEGYQSFLESWQGISMFTYVLLDRPLDVADMTQKMQAIVKKNNGIDFLLPTIQPLSAVHLHSKDILFESNANKSDILNVYVLSIIALLILLLAVVNFMNLVTAKSTSRAKEVGMRKVIGAVRHQLITQHLTESIVITLVSGMLAFAMVFALTPWLNSIYQRFADANVLLMPNNLIIMLALILVVGVLAGLYPAFVLSSFKPAIVLKGAFKNSTGGIQLRKALVVLQFTISIALMVGTGIVYQQMRFIYTADLGYSRDQIITIQQTGNRVNNATTLKNELLRNPNISAVGTASARIGQQLGRTGIIPEGYPTDVNMITSIMTADETYIPTMNMRMVQGRNFSLDYDDSLSMIVNEEMLKLLNWEEGVGKKISLQTGPNPTDLTAYTIVGVVKNFHFATIRHQVEPMFMLYGANNSAMAIKVKAEDMKATITYIQDTWNKVNNGSTFEYDFLDGQFANLYRNEQAFASMFNHFTALAIIIAGLGLFALSAFTAEQRKKEIGVRKVLGASSTSILYKLSKEFIQLILVAFIMASLIAYFVMKEWLSDFQYSIEIGFGIFIAAGGLSLLIALTTISFQAMKAALVSPIESLRSE